MAHSPAVAKAHSALSIHFRWHPDDVDGIAERRRAFVTEKLAATLQRTLDAAPPLTADQLDRLVSVVQDRRVR